MMRLATATAIAVATIACNSSPPQNTPCEPQTGFSDASSAYGQGYPIEALPKGACTGSASCQMTILKLCDAGAPLYDGYVCQCTNGTWQCDDRYPDLAVCTTVPVFDAAKDVQDAAGDGDGAASDANDAD